MTSRINIEAFDQWERVTLSSPATLNALSDSMTSELLDYFTRLADRPEVRVVVLQGDGRGFCSGLDLSSEMGRVFAEAGPVEKFAAQARLRNIIIAMRRCPQPIVAAIHGVAAGGGFSLALASDIRVAAEGARMHAAFIRIGSGGCDLGSSYLLPRLIGSSAAAELLLTGRSLPADRALRLGLLADVVPSEQLGAAVQQFVDEMLATGPLALRMTKEALNYNIDASGLEAALALEDRQQVLLTQTYNFANGVNSFRRKEAPVYNAEGDAVYGSRDYTP